MDGRNALTHLFVCREYPPAAYPPGGIGTYVRQMTRLLAAAGDTVHVIAHRWDGAPLTRESLVDGRLIVHRVALDETPAVVHGTTPDIAHGLLASSYPAQAFSWHAALLAEQLIEGEGIEVIEAQEWEAPLYYLQLRRALNLGPSRRPPCVVHIHSPSEQIFAANHWDTTIADYPPVAALEAYSIAGADAVLCPSWFVAEQTMARYRVTPSTVTVIPYPLGDAPRVARAADVWASPSVCHVGRLEPRKGVLEWAEAIARVAPEYPSLRAEFVGGDTPMHVTGESSVRRAMLARVPRALHRHLHFHGTKDREGVVQVLARSCAAVVPSRWENFPYSCIEAMASGLPVIASPNGGMREMIVDDESGWIAADGTPEGLAAALRRALEAPAPLRERMGASAGRRIREICDSATIVQRHREMKRALAQAGAPRSSQLQRAALQPDLSPERSRVDASDRRGIGVVVAWSSDQEGRACLTSLRSQTVPPTGVCIVSDRELPSDTAAGMRDLSTQLTRAGESLAAACRRAAAALLSADPCPAVLVFLDGRACLTDQALAQSLRAFEGTPSLGLLSAWTREIAPRGRVHIQPCPSLPHLWHDGGSVPYVAVRTQAYLESSTAASSGTDQVLQDQMLDGISRAGWSAVTYPAVFVSIALTNTGRATRPSRPRYSSMARGVQRLHMPILEWFRSGSPQDRRALLWQGLTSPGRTLRLLASRAFPKSLSHAARRSR